MRRPGDANRGYSSIVPRLIFNLNDDGGGEGVSREGVCCLAQARAGHHLDFVAPSTITHYVHGTEEKD